MNQHTENEISEGSQNIASEPNLVAHAALPATGQVRPSRKLRRLLRGRFLWAILLGVIGAVAGAVGAYKSVTPLYRGMRLIEVKPFIPRVMYKTEETQVMPMFDQFVVSQMGLMQHPQVLEQAMTDSDWTRFNRGMSPEAKQEFRDGLEVNRQRRSTLISISFTDEDPEAAKAAVKAITVAYMEIFGERAVKEGAERLKKLDERKNKFGDEIKSLNMRIKGLARKYRSASLDEMHRFKVQEMHTIKQDLTKTKLELVSAGVPLEPDSKDKNDNAEQKKWEDMSVREIARNDRHMHGLLEEQRLLDRTIKVKRVHFADKHPDIQELLKLRSVSQQDIETYAAEFRRNGPSDWAAKPVGAEGNVKSVSVAALHARKKRLKKFYDKTADETLKLGERNITITGLKEDRALAKELLEQTKDRIEQITVELGIGGRFVISESVVSPMPVNAGKRKQLAVLGFVGGGTVGLGLILLIGFCDRRLRSSEDAEMSIGNVRMLGLLPYLPNDLSNPDNVAIACYGVHHIRTLLQLGRDGVGIGRQVFTVTGPEPETGKTSLTLALGLSFASAGCKTLLIDCDLSGAGLTHRLQTIIQRRMGQILHREGLIGEQHLQQALRLAQTESKRLGETLVEMGLLDEDDLAEALRRQQEMPIGLLDALNGEPLEACTAKTEITNLVILPAGGAEASDVSRVSPVSMRRLINEARSHFDTILIDTGPIPDAVIGGIAASVADQTLLIVSRGDQRTSTEKAIAFLESIGVHLAGVVFNRAAARDIARSKFSSALSTLSRRSARTDSPDGNGRGWTSRQTALVRTDHFDPVTRAVVAASGVQNEDDTD